METIANYAYKVYWWGSFTKAAKELYISQPSLSAAISRLENELGFKIFDRSTIPCSLTAEGRIYIDSLEEIIESENNMRERIRKLSDVKDGFIRVGGTSYTSYLLLSEICGRFCKKYPGIAVTVDIGNVGGMRVLWDKLGNKELDILVTYYNRNPQYAAEMLLEEQLAIAMNRNMPGAEKIKHLAVSREELLTKTYSPDKEIEDMSIFSDIPFLEYPRGSDTAKRMGKILGNYKASVCDIQNSRHSEMHYNLMCEGVGAVITHDLTVKQKPFDENVIFFVTKCEESHRRVFLVYNDSSNNNPVIKKFIKTAKEIYEEK